MELPKYTKLGGMGVARQGLLSVGVLRCRLYLGDDHLMQVESSGYNEEYRRFYFRDIQAITIQLTREWFWTNLALAVFAVLFGVAAFFTTDSAGQVALGIFFTFFFLPLIINLILGPTCKTMIRTAVQQQQLPSLGRLKEARKAMAKLRPLVEAAQGAFTPEELTFHLQNSAAHTAFDSRAVAPPPLAHYGGGIHKALFWVCAADLILTPVSALTKVTWLQPFMWLHIIAVFGLGIAAIFRALNESRLDPLIQLIPWFVVATMVVFLTLPLMWRPEGMDTAMMLVSTTMNGAGGIIGLMRLARWTQARVTPLPPPVNPPPASTNS